MIGQEMEADSAEAGELLREIIIQGYELLRRSYAEANTPLPEYQLEVCPAGESPDLGAAVSAKVSIEHPNGELVVWVSAREEIFAQKSGSEKPAAGEAAVEAAPADFPDLGPETMSSGDGAPPNFNLLADVELEISVELGRRRMPLADLLRLTTGSVIELEKLVGEPLDVYANGRLIAEGEAVVIDEQFGVRITRLASLNQRASALS